MKKLIVIIIGTVLLGNSAYSQKNTWSIGVRTAFRVERVINNRHYPNVRTIPHVWQTLRIGMPPAEINFSYNITDKLRLKTGITYYQYQLQTRKNRFFRGLEKTYMENIKPFRSLEFPLIVRYDFPLRKIGFSFFVHTGLVMEFVIGRQSIHLANDMPTIMFQDQRCLLNMGMFRFVNSTRVGVLLNGGFGFAYRLKTGWQISLSGEYNIAHSSRGGELEAHMKIHEEFTLKTIDEGVETRRARDYFDIGLGVSYTFKRKIKE
jgi:hypothetical protein